MMAADPDTGVMSEIRRWAMLELAPWRCLSIGRAALAAALRAEAEAHPSIFLMHVADGGVTLDDKSHSYAAPPGGDYGRAMAYRAAEYRNFLEQVVRRFVVSGAGTIAVDLEDLGQARFRVPIFAFQKRRGANTMLLPDVDFLLNDFFSEDRTVDPERFEAKQDAAIFVGSTTGDPWLTAAHVASLRNARLRAAVFFRDVADVTFELPNIVQVDSNETALMIERLGVRGQLRGWAEQARCKFLLSIDGNGATCSRVVRSLLGNNVLLKYNSPYLLYYFHGLAAWRHFIPIMQDSDVIDVLRSTGENGALYRDVAARSRDFAMDHLSADAVMAYAAELLNGYLRLARD